jgi:pteridine reductase
MDKRANSGKKTALVTGSGKRRIGWHVARALGERGYRLAIHYRTSVVEADQTVAEFTKLGFNARAFQADFYDERSLEQLIEQVTSHFGGVDVLVNSAAAFSRRRLEEVTAADVRSFLEVNTLAPFVCAQRIGLAMTTRPDGGCIVNISDWAIARPYLDYAPYLLSKGAIPTLTRILAVELASRNPKVRVNCIAPGPVMWPEGMPTEEKREALAGTLLQSAGSPENIVQAVLFLIDNQFMTGTCVTVDGGRTVLGAG